MLQNAYFLAKIGADTAENEQHFAEILPTAALLVKARPVPSRSRAPAEPQSRRRRLRKSAVQTVDAQVANPRLKWKGALALFGSRIKLLLL